jgi:hypothetical protein
MKARQVFRDELTEYMVPNHPRLEAAMKADRAFVEWERSQLREDWVKFLRLFALV